MQYDYRCVICGGVQTLERSIHAEADNPVCCEQMMGRMYTVPGISFNASGFYSTDKEIR
jgi:predicted nucleic acid-binding Zn ribbon protein